MSIRRSAALCYALVATLAACHSASQSQPQSAPRELPEHSLSGLAAQHIVLLPTYAVRIAPGLAWSGSIGRPVEVQRTMDADLLAALDEKGLRKIWIFPEDLQQSFR